MRRVADGDQTALWQLVRLHGHGMTVVATRYLGRRDEAEDVIQEAWLRVWHRAGRFDPERARPTTWIYRIMINLCIDRLRRRRLLTMIGLDEAGPDPDDPQPDAVRTLAARQRLAAVRRDIARLPDRQRMALLLSVAGGLEAGDIAAALGTSRAAAEQLLARARRTLRAREADRLETPDKRTGDAETQYRG